MVHPIHGGKACKRCNSTKVTRYKKRISNGSYQVIDQCDWCGQNANGPGINVPHSQVTDLDALPILADYTQHAPECEACGSRQGVEYHHWAPRHVFGAVAEEYPKSYLCPDCHQHWHTTIASHNPSECRYCKGLAGKAKT